MSVHDCGHVCCDERTDPHHDHFLRPVDCPFCADCAESDVPYREGMDGSLMPVSGGSTTETIKAATHSDQTGQPS